jgi:hypothetical protein
MVESDRHLPATIGVKVGGDWYDVIRLDCIVAELTRGETDDDVALVHVRHVGA